MKAVHYLQGVDGAKGKFIDRSPCGSTKLTDRVSDSWLAITCLKCLKSRPKAKGKGEKCH